MGNRTTRGRIEFFDKFEFETLPERKIRLDNMLRVVVRYLRIKKFNLQERKKFIVAYRYFSSNPTKFDGATIVKDAYDLPNLELSAMLHDYQYIKLLPKYKKIAWVKKKKSYDLEYMNNLIKFGVLKKSRAKWRYWMLRLSTPFYPLWSLL